MQHVSILRFAYTSGLAGLLALTACGGGNDSSSQVASLGSTPGAGSTADSTSPADSQEAMLAYAACMRENGLDMADPTFDADGNMTGGGIGRDSGLDPRSEEFQTAQEACGSLIEGVEFGGGPGGNLDRDAIQTAMTDFTACLRDEGLEVDDITMGDPGQGGPGAAPGGDLPAGDGTVPPGGFDGGPNGAPPDGAAPGGPGGEGFDPTAMMIRQLGLDDTDPAVTAALETCQPIIDSAFETATTEA